MKNIHITILALGIIIFGGLAYCALISSGIAIAELILDTHTPRVKLLYPRGGEEFSGIVEISWIAEDPDGDPVSITIEYIAHYERCIGGVCDIRWRNIVVGMNNDGAFQWDTSELKDGSYIIKVIANDGVEKSEDVSGWIDISNQQGESISR